MFYESGIRAVRMDDIAAACGISKRTLYENFADREELIRQTLRSRAAKYREVMDAELENAGNAIEEFWIIFNYSNRHRLTHARILQDLMKFYPSIFDDFTHKHRGKIEDDNRDRFERGIKEGLIIKEIDSMFMSKLLTSYLYGLKSDFEKRNFSNDNDTINEEDSFKFATMLFFRGIATEKGRKYIDSRILGIRDTAES